MQNTSILFLFFTQYINFAKLSNEQHHIGESTQQVQILQLYNHHHHHDKIIPSFSLSLKNKIKDRSI